MAILKHNNNSISNVTSFALVPSGSPVLLATSTASASASISFTTGIDSTYDIYKFEFYNIHPATNAVAFQFNLSTDSGSNYNVTKTSTAFQKYHDEADSAAGLTYETSRDLAQSTAFQLLTSDVGNGADESLSGSLILFNPASTTYVKHFISVNNDYNSGDYFVNYHIAGYGNTTSAVDAIRFQFSSGNIDAGTIKMYGIKGN
jgi:hypothetical protein